MKGSRLQLLAAAAAIALAWALWSRGGEVPVKAPAIPAPAQPAEGFAGGALSEAVRQSGAPGSTPPVAQPAGAGSGFVEARVLAQGRPAAGAHVRLYLRGRADRNTGAVEWRFAGAADAGRDGIARIAARPGAYLAAARSGSFAPARLEFQRPAGEKATKIALELLAGVALSGRTVQKGSSDPVPLALVTLTYGSRRPEAPAEEQARATSDVQGRFRIDGLAPGRYVATAQVPGYARATARVEAPGDITLPLAQASFIEGHVVAADGSPAAGAEVSATGGEDAVSAAASETGSFSLEVAPRTWAVSARRGDQAGRAVEPVAVAAGATARGVTIRLGAACSIAGTVVAAASKQPIAGAQIAVSPYGSNGDFGRAVSDAGGAFSAGGLAPGSYDVAVTAAGFTDGSRRGVTVDQGQSFPLRIELRQTGAIEGTVRDSGGRGVAFALVLPAVRVNRSRRSRRAPARTAPTASAGSRPDRASSPPCATAPLSARRGARRCPKAGPRTSTSRSPTRA